MCGFIRADVAVMKLLSFCNSMQTKRSGMGRISNRTQTIMAASSLSTWDLGWELLDCLAPGERSSSHCEWTSSEGLHFCAINAFYRGEADIKVDPRIAIAQLHAPKSCPCGTSWMWACSTAFSSTSMLMTSAWSDLASSASSNSCSHSAWCSLKLLYDFLSSSFILWTFAWRSLLSNSRPSNNSVNSSITSSTALSWWSFYPTDLVRWVMRSLGFSSPLALSGFLEPHDERNLQLLLASRLLRSQTKELEKRRGAWALVWKQETTNNTKPVPWCPYVFRP